MTPMVKFFSVAFLATVFIAIQGKSISTSQDVKHTSRIRRSPPVVAALSALLPLVSTNGSAISISSMISSLTTSDRKHLTSANKKHEQEHKDKESKISEDSNMKGTKYFLNSKEATKFPPYVISHIANTFKMLSDPNHFKQLEKEVKIKRENDVRYNKNENETEQNVDQVDLQDTKLGSLNESNKSITLIETTINDFGLNETNYDIDIMNKEIISTTPHSISDDFINDSINPIISTKVPTALENINVETEYMMGNTTNEIVLVNENYFVNITQPTTLYNENSFTIAMENISNATTEESISFNSTSTLENKNHIDLNLLEKKLSNETQQKQKDLLLAISLLQHHSISELLSEKGDANEKNNKVSSTNPTPIEQRENNEVTTETNFKEPLQIPNDFKVEINPAVFADEFDNIINPKNKTETNSTVGKGNSKKHNANKKPNKVSKMKWFVLEMEGDCSIIRNRMATFVTFLKAALSSRLNCDFDDIFVPSVFCDHTFMVNISLDTVKYPTAHSHLQHLAHENTTLLEISGEIFYLEKILTQRSVERFSSNPISQASNDIELVIYIAVSCMFIFILLSIAILVLIKLCRNDGDSYDSIKPDYQSQFESAIKQPSVIYSHRFSQELDPEKHHLKQHEEFSNDDTSGIGPCSSGTFPSLKYGSERTEVHHDHYERKSHMCHVSSSTKLELLEEVDEEELEDDFHMNEDEEDLDDNEFIDNDLETLFSSSEHDTTEPNLFMSRIQNVCSNDKDFQIGFDNPCYDR